MSSAYRDSQSRRQSWKGGAPADVDPRAARRVRRILGTLFAASLLACFAWVLYRMSLPDATTYALCVAIEDYDVVQAPPLPFAAATLGEFEPLAERTGVKLFRQSDVKTAEALRRLFQQGLPRAAQPDKDVVIVYLAAHGVSQSDRQGAAQAWLLGSDYTSFRDGSPIAAGKLVLDDVLAAMRSCRAATKVLLLDAGSIESDLGLGMIINEFPALVKDQISQSADADTWVLLSNDVFEKSHAAFADRCSVFGYYVAHALAGDADIDGDGVDLSELFDYVGDHVARYVWQATGQRETQTPVLASGGDQSGLLARASELRLTPPRPANTAEDTGDEGRRQASGVSRQAIGKLALIAAPSARPAPSDSAAPNEAPATATRAPASTAAVEKTAVEAPAVEKSKDVKPASVADKAPAEQPASKAPAVAGDKKQSTSKTKKTDAVGESLRSEWLACEQLCDRSLTRWTPVDYAPRQWLRHVEILRGYELQWLLGAGSQLAKQRLTKGGDQADWDTARQQFERGPAKPSFEQHTALSSAIQLRDDLLFRLRYYAAWSAGNESDANQVAQLIGRLAELLPALNEPPARQSEKGKPPSVAEWLADLNVLRDDIERRKDRLDGAWQDAVRACLTSDRDNLVAVERLLGLPWLSAGDRSKLLDRLKSSPRLAGLGDLRPRESRRQIELRARQRASRLANLEWRLLRLATTPDSNQEEQFRQQCHRLGQASPAEMEAARKVGAALADAYRELVHAGDGIDLANNSDQNGTLEDRVRLADLRSDVEGLGDTALLGHPYPDLRIAWKLGLAVLTAPPAGAALATDADTEIAWRIDAAPPAPVPAKWSLDYDASLLSVGGATKGTIVLKPNAAAEPLRFAVRARSESGGKATLGLRIEAPTAPARSEVTLILPQWQPIDLVVAQPSGLLRAAATTDGRGLKRIVLQPLASGKSVFHLELYNPSPRERKIKYQFFPLTKSGLSARALRSWPLKPNGEWLPTVKPLEAAPVAITLAAQEKKLVSFPPFPRPAAPDSAPPATPKADAPAAGQEKSVQIGDGLMCEVTDLSTGPPAAPRRFWIDLAALHPRRYVVPMVRYNWQKQRVEVDVRPREVGRLPDEGSTVVWRTEGLAGEEFNPIIGKLTADVPGLSLSAKVEAEKVPKDRPLEVLLDVDGYPRAFRYDVWCDRPRGESPRKESPDLRFLSPPTDTTTWLNNGTPLSAMLRVDAPPDWFEEAEHVVEVSVRAEPRQTSVFGGERRFEAFLLPAENDGDMTIEGRVGELQVEFGSEAYPDQDVDVDALLVDTDRQAKCTFGLDGKAPYFEFARSQPKAIEGKNLSLSFRVFDDRSGVEKVEAAIDADDSRELKQPLTARPNTASGDVYEISLPTKQLTPGRWTALIRATDKAGNISAVQPLRFEIAAEVATPGKTGEEKKTTRLVATVKYYGAVAAGYRVMVTGPKNATIATDRNGQFTLEQLPPGSYKFQFEGVARNTKVKFEQELTVEPPAAKPQRATFDGR